MPPGMRAPGAMIGAVPARVTTPAFVGRSAELAALLDAFGLAAQGHGTMAVGVTPARRVAARRSRIAPCAATWTGSSRPRPPTRRSTRRSSTWSACWRTRPPSCGPAWPAACSPAGARGRRWTCPGPSSGASAPPCRPNGVNRALPCTEPSKASVVPRQTHTRPEGSLNRGPRQQGPWSVQLDAATARGPGEREPRAVVRVRCRGAGPAARGGRWGRRTAARTTWPA